MGLFDIFKSKKGPEQPQAQAQAQAPMSPWQQRFALWRDLEDEQKLALCGELLGEISPHLESGKIVPLPDDDEIELRARVEGIPVRVNLTDSGWVNIEMKIQNRVGPLTLERDHEKIPKHKDADDDWADEDELRVFVARGIFVEGWEDDVNESFGTLQNLPQGFVPWLCGEMERLQMSRLYAHADTMSVGFDPNIYEMADPIRHLMESIHVMKSAAQAFASGDRDMSAEPKVQFRGQVQIGGQVVDPSQMMQAAAPVQRVKCSYCSTLFVLGNASHCPNCGAPYTG